MKIGIDGSRAFIKNRTGIEEYSYQVIKNLTNELKDHECFLYVRKNQIVDFELPENWKIKIIKWPRFWTQLGLSLEMILNQVDALFVPAHTVPMIHPEKTVVVVHGLEYEFCPSAYSFWDRIYMRVSIKNSCRWASKIISVSKNTKKDLEKLYGVLSDKIEVIYEGWGSDKLHATGDKGDPCLMSHVPCLQKYLLFIGRIEERKNIINIVKAFEILKHEYKIPHKLLLAGKPGFGHWDIMDRVLLSMYADDIIELGFVSDEEKWQLLKKAEVFVFPTLYEGFGIPVLESQSAGCPVVAGSNSSIPEVAGDSALLVDAKNPQEIADNIYRIISDESLRDDIIQKGLENVKKFSWEKCAKEIAKSLTV